MSGGYYNIEPHASIQEVVDKWQKEGLKAYDASIPLMVPLREVWPYREYTWSRNDSRPNGVTIKGEWSGDLTGPQKWDILMEELKTSGWDPNKPLFLSIGRQGGAKVGEGNHRLAIAKELGFQKVPVWFQFYSSRVVKEPQHPEAPIAVKPQTVKKVLEKELAEPRIQKSPEEEAEIERMLDDILGGRWKRATIKRVALRHLARSQAPIHR
jgi:hypothetical protein